MIMHSKKIFFLICFFGLALAEAQAKGPSDTNEPAAISWWSNLFSFRVDSTQNKEDLKEAFTHFISEAQKLPTLWLSEIDKPENKKKIDDVGGKIVPKVVLDYINGSDTEKKKILGDIMAKTNNLINNIGQAAEDYKVYDNIRARFYPSTLDLAYYGFVFGSAVFIGFNGLYYVQQKLRDYLAIRKPKYISPLSKIGLFDLYKQKLKTFFYGLKKRANDIRVESIESALKKNCITSYANKKLYSNGVIHFTNDHMLKNESIRLLGNVSNRLEMDFIAVPSINLLQKNTVIDICNELVHVIHKNSRPVLLYIDNIALLSMDGTEYSEREECIRIIASFLKSSADILNTKCMIVGVMDDKESLEGPFVEIYTKQVYL